MDRNEIIQAVKSYIKNENAKYALLINGAWGSGKTFLYENYLVDAISDIEVGKTDRKINIYISLYGVSTIEALSKQLLTNYLIYAKANDNELVKKGLKPVAGILGIVSKAISFSIGAISVDFSNTMQELSGLIEPRNLVICFDDLERCAISVNDFFGYVNNLIEHCNCKVLILSDENNIGRIFANTNIEQKYQTILTADRKVIPNKEDNNKKNNSLSGGEICISDLKKLNNLLYSENYIYHDIKEKVIGKTCNYYPQFKELFVELIDGNDKHNGYVSNEKYKDFLLQYLNEIVSFFNDVGNRNLRIVITWLDMFNKVFEVTEKNLNNSEYYEKILLEYMKYSIWAVVAYSSNKRIRKSAYHGSLEYVYVEGHEYNYTARYYFIDKFIKTGFLDDTDLIKVARTIETRCEREKLYKKTGIMPTPHKEVI